MPLKKENDPFDNVFCMTGFLFGLKVDFSHSKVNSIHLAARRIHYFLRFRERFGGR